MFKAANDRIATFATLDRYFNQDNEHPNIFIEYGCANLWMELTGAVFDRRPGIIATTEDIDPRLPDHAIDALRYGSHSFIAGPEITDKPLPRPDQAREALRQEQHDAELRNAERNLARHIRSHRL